MSKFKVKCVKGESDFILMIKADNEVDAVDKVYEKYQVDHAVLHTDRFIDVMQRKQGSFRNTFRRSSRGRCGQVIFS